ncbi:MAG TPA: hypothetical protein VJC18_01595, partial [bacterium]|nr:hypothetical protein [bacterium]
GELKHFIKLGKKNPVLIKLADFFASGIGPVAAAYGLTRYLCQHKPDLIITGNTAGIINSKKFAVGDLVLAKTITPCARSKESFCPSIIKPIVAVPNKVIRHFQLTMPKIKTASVFCPQEISCSLSLGRRLKLAGFEVETLETYAYHHVAKKFDIPIVSFLGLTNLVGPNAHAEWKKNEAFVCQKLARVIATLISIR